VGWNNLGVFWRFQLRNKVWAGIVLFWYKFEIWILKKVKTNWESLLLSWTGWVGLGSRRILRVDGFELRFRQPSLGSSMGWSPNFVRLIWRVLSLLIVVDVCFSGIVIWSTEVVVCSCTLLDIDIVVTFFVIIIGPVGLRCVWVGCCVAICRVGRSWNSPKKKKGVAFGLKRGFWGYFLNNSN